MTSSYLLSHTLNNCPFDSYFSYVKDYEGDPPPKSKLLVDSKYVGVRFANQERTKVFIDNPILTDETQSVHTDIHRILKENPDINGMSLILEDDAAQAAANSVQLEDFLKPARYRDVFDIYDFVKQAERSFVMLPASLRKAYNNSPADLCNALSKNDPRALAAISEFLGISPDSKSASKATDDNSLNTNKNSDAVAPSSEDKQ